MPALSDSTQRADAGADIVGLGLSDVIQINQHNRFSGCIAIESPSGSGLLFFRDGDIIHAEQGKQSGEEAFYDILGWPPGRLRLEPNVATTRSTIQKSSQHLLLDAARVLDERRSRRPPGSPSAEPRPPLRSGEVLERLRRLPGVACVAMHGKDGSHVADESYEAEALAGQALFLSMIGSQLGALLQAGGVLSAAVHGSARHLLLFATKSHFLSVLVNGDRPPGPVEAEVRRVLSGAR